MSDLLTRATWTLLLMLLSSICLAEANPAQVLHDLHAARLSVHSTEAAFHRYQSSEGDRKLLLNLNEALGTLKSNFQTAYKDLVDMGMGKELDEVRNHWKQAAKNLNSAMTAIAGSGFAEGQITNGYLLNSFHTARSLQSAYENVVSATHFKVTPVLQSLRDEATLFREMSALYMEQSSTQYGYTYRSEAGDEETLDVMARRFAANLNQVEKLMANNPDAINNLNNLRNKWEFLEKSFLNYKEKTVPYLVVKFGGEIITDLQTLTASFEQG